MNHWFTITFSVGVMKGNSSEGSTIHWMNEEHSKSNY